MLIKLKKAGDNPKQLPYTWIVGPDTDEDISLEIGDNIHIEGHPDDVRWIVESIEVGNA